MAKFSEGERFMLQGSLTFGTVLNNNCDGTYEVLISERFIQLQEKEMCKVWSWSKFRTKIENGIIAMMDFAVWKMILILAVAAMITILVAFIHALFLLS